MAEFICAWCKSDTPDAYGGEGVFCSSECNFDSSRETRVTRQYEVMVCIYISAEDENDAADQVAGLIGQTPYDIEDII